MRDIYKLNEIFDVYFPELERVALLNEEFEIPRFFSRRSFKLLTSNFLYELKFFFKLQKRYVKKDYKKGRRKLLRKIKEMKKAVKSPINGFLEDVKDMENLPVVSNSDTE